MTSRRNEVYDRMAEIIWSNADAICQAKGVALEFSDKSQQQHRNYIGSVGIDELSRRLRVGPEELTKGATVGDLEAVCLWKLARALA